MTVVVSNVCNTYIVRVSVSNFWKVCDTKIVYSLFTVFNFDNHFLETAHNTNLIFVIFYIKSLYREYSKVSSVLVEARVDFFILK